MNAMAQALQFLQYSTPSDSSNPGRTLFIYGVTMTVPHTTGGCTTAQLYCAIQSSTHSGSIPLASAGELLEATAFRSRLRERFPSGRDGEPKHRTASNGDFSLRQNPYAGKNQGDRRDKPNNA